MGRRPKRLAVFLPNWVGDVVMATPALRALRERFDDTQITFIGRPSSLDILKGSPWADETLTDHSSGRKLRECFVLMRALRRHGFTRGILMSNSFRVALLARLGGVRRIAGYSRDGRGWLLSRRLKAPRDANGFIPTPAIDYYCRLAEAVGAACTSRQMELPLTSDDAQAAENLLAGASIDPSRPLVMLNPGAAFGTSKLWAPQRFAAVADALVQRHGAQIIINAAPRERAIAQEVASAMTQPPAVNMAQHDNTLGLLKGLLKRCRLLITNDTGARHIAAASGIAIVTVFGSTDPAWTTLDCDRERIVRVAMLCSPCQKKTCPEPAGPAYHQCMTAVTTDMVLAACEELLAPTGSPSPRPAEAPER